MKCRKDKKTTRGFTLLELVIAIGLLGMLTVAGTTLFFSAIRGGGKVGITTEVKQNGQFVVNSMQQLIRNSLNIPVCSPTPSQTLTLEARDGAALTFACTDVGTETGYIASNSARMTSTDVTVEACSFTCSEDGSGLRGPLVTIDFTLRQTGTGGDVSDSAQGQFTTSVSLRSY